jgi:DNA-binding NarL/FixJ family response regulator
VPSMLGSARSRLRSHRSSAQHAADDRLIDREIEVLRQIASGCSNKVIAHRLEISDETLKGHVRSIPSKLNASDRTHAVTIAMKRGFLKL